MALDKIQDICNSALPVKEIKNALNEDGVAKLDHAIGSLPAFLIRKLFDTYRNILVVYPEDETAPFLKSDLDALGLEQVTRHLTATHHHPYDQNQVIDSAVMVQRSEVLDAIRKNDRNLVVTSTPALFEKMTDPEEFEQSSLQISKGDQVEPDQLKEELADQNYKHVKFVDEPGEFASRGGIMDVYPFSGEFPVRIEFFGDEVDSIREFDPDSQRSVAFLNEARFVPNASEMGSKPGKSLFSYLDKETLVLQYQPDLVAGKLEELFEEAEEAYAQLEDVESVHEPETLFLNQKEFSEETENLKQLYWGGFSKSTLGPDAPSITINASPQPDFNSSIKLLRENIQSLSSQGFDTYILCDNEGQRDRFEELLGEPSKKLRYHLSLETLHEGFILNDEAVAVYTDHQIFNRYHRPKIKRRRYHGGLSFKELRDLNIGDYVVHVDYGIGQFAGFKNITVRDVEQEAVVLRYKDNSVLYVNVSSLHKLQKYSGQEGSVPRVTKLGSGEWQRKKNKTKKRVKDIARDLIKLYAKRKSQKAYQFSPDNSWQTELEAMFEFEETPDQMETINSVKEDMKAEQPMDRLVCGDVGFGKTEVAVRAAFKAVNDHKQVALLVPTTILADQHYKTFKRRMEPFPISIEVVSRFKSKAEQKKIIERTKECKVDILIGTHRLLSKDIKFKDLGLMIVDEEQRFGVQAKERLKEFRASIDVLTLTATPIPRTLQFSLMGARDLSIIKTPPPNRQPVYTEIHSFNTELIRDAIMQEMNRGGQVFFIHNRVKNIEQVADMIRQLVPDTRVRFAHGQMHSNKLEKIITDFYEHKFDVLVSTNIVENGIDISNANTMVINRANHFGLAELHQLRGRVGRSNRKAFCYLITPPVQQLTPEARKRLTALEEFSDLGSGFNIAMRDLDIRGAGDILGAEQSGFINDIGFQLYTKIVNDAVKELKETEFQDVFEDTHMETELPETSVEFDLPAILPRDYVEDNVERLNLYRKLAEAKELEEIEDWEEEMKDRFGELPEGGQNLVKAAKIKYFASRSLFVKVIVRSNRMWLTGPKSESDLGKRFYEGGIFPAVMKNLEEHYPDQYNIAQKNNAVRIILSEINGLDDALELLKKVAEPVETASVV